MQRPPREGEPLGEPRPAAPLDSRIANSTISFRAVVDRGSAGASSSRPGHALLNTCAFTGSAGRITSMSAHIAQIRALSPFGPIFGKELRVTSRRKRSYALRVLYLAVL